MKPVLDSCPTCLQPWNVAMEAKALTLSASASTLALLQIMIVAWAGDDPEMRAWAEIGLREYAALVKRHTTSEVHP